MDGVCRMESAQAKDRESRSDRDSYKNKNSVFTLFLLLPIKGKNGPIFFITRHYQTIWPVRHECFSLPA